MMTALASAMVKAAVESLDIGAAPSGIGAKARLIAQLVARLISNANNANAIYPFIQCNAATT
jgi:hypothetical protein